MQGPGDQPGEILERGTVDGHGLGPRVEGSAAGTSRGANREYDLAPEVETRATISDARSRSRGSPARFPGLIVSLETAILNTQFPGVVASPVLGFNARAVGFRTSRRGNGRLAAEAGFEGVDVLIRDLLDRGPTRRRSGRGWTIGGLEAGPSRSRSTGDGTRQASGWARIAPRLAEVASTLGLTRTGTWGCPRLRGDSKGSRPTSPSGGSRPSTSVGWARWPGS